MSLYLSVLNKMLFNKGIHVHFISQNCRVESKIKHSMHCNILADSGNFKRELRGVSTFSKEKGTFNLYLNFQTRHMVCNIYPVLEMLANLETEVSYLRYEALSP